MVFALRARITQQFIVMAPKIRRTSENTAYGFAKAILIFDGPAVTAVDGRFDYDEMR